MSITGNHSGGAYSRFVQLMRVGLPIIAAGIVLLVITWPQFENKSPRFKLSISDVDTDKAVGQKIINPRYTGTDSKHRPYTITAKSAYRTHDKPQTVKLTSIKAKLVGENGAWLALSAEAGIYDRNLEFLDLKNGVNLIYNNEYEIHTQTARIELLKGRAVGRDFVTGHGPAGTLEASGFQILESEQHLRFVGKSKLVIFRNKAKISEVFKVYAMGSTDGI